MKPVHSLQGLVEHVGPRLRLRWLTPPPSACLPLLGGAPGQTVQSLVGSLNCIHPNRLQVLGEAEMAHLADLSAPSFDETIGRLFAARPAAIIFASDIEPQAVFFELAQATGTTLLGSSASDVEIVDRLQYFLTHALAERTTVHGVFLEVLGMGVLLVGDPGVGKSELALEMITRGHRLIADDAPQFARITPESLEGSCPQVLRDFLEVRGLGVLNIRAMFGEGAVRQRETLNLIVSMRSFESNELAQIDRLHGSLSSRTILSVAVPEITLPVAPGRNLAVLLETAVRNQILRIRGYDAGVDMIDRQARAIEHSGPGDADPQPAGMDRAGGLDRSLASRS
jgi:HPr kinase/phosphorylase